MQEQYRGKVLDAGQVAIPEAFCEAFSISPGDEVIITRSEYGIEVTPLHHAVRRAQELVARYTPADADLVAELRAFRDQDGPHDE